MKVYGVKEIFTTLQGEGMNTGRAAVFIRFSGCNLWSGLEEDRAGAVCRFCDTDFFGLDGDHGGCYTASSLTRYVEKLWLRSCHEPSGREPLLVLTGGEPMLQVDAYLIDRLIAFAPVAIETNGTVAVPQEVADACWLTVSPKAGTTIRQRSGDEIKLVYPQPGLMPEDVQEMIPRAAFRHWLLQPMDGPLRAEHTAATVARCRADPDWRLSLQTHKLLEIP